jgi:hypothetical protein
MVRGSPPINLPATDHRIETMLKYMSDSFDTAEFDSVLLHMIKKKSIGEHVSSVIPFAAIMENLAFVADQHQKQRGVHTWNLLQAVTAVLYSPGNNCSIDKFHKMTGLPQHYFKKTVEVLCKEATAADRSGTRNPHLHLVEEWALENMMHSPHSSVFDC